MTKQKKIKIIVLAGGLGKRMGNVDLPKVLLPLKGEPIVNYVLRAIHVSGVDNQPVIIIGKMAEKVKKVLGPDYLYVHQAEQLGTGHAVASAKDVLLGKADHILVLYGDMPLISPETINNITATHLHENCVLTMATVTVPDFADWRAGFSDFGRIIRGPQGELTGIVEKKDATSTQLAIKEVNPSYFCFQADWLWQNINKLTNTNKQGEYCLPDLAGLAFQQGKKIVTVAIKPEEALGVNSSDHLRLIDRLK